MVEEVKKKSGAEFTKVMVVVLVFIFFAFYGFSIFTYLYDGRYLKELSDYISKVFAIICSCYLVKSSIQNNTKIRKQYDPNQVKKKITFSKMLILLIFLAFIFSSVFFCYYWFTHDVFPSYLFEYIATPFITILPTYLAKAVIENYGLDNISVTDFVSSMSSFDFSSLVSSDNSDYTLSEDTSDGNITVDEEVVYETNDGNELIDTETTNTEEYTSDENTLG